MWGGGEWNEEFLEGLKFNGCVKVCVEDGRGCPLCEHNLNNCCQTRGKACQKAARAEVKMPRDGGGAPADGSLRSQTKIGIWADGRQ